MSRHDGRLLFLGGFLWLACATRNPTDVAPASPSASSSGASSGSCFRGNVTKRGGVPLNDAGLASLPPGVTLSRNEARGAVQHYMPLIRKCFQAANLRSPNPEGHVVAGMSVASDGTVSDSWILGRDLDGVGGDVELEDCLGRVMCEIVFPKPRGNARTVVYQAFQFGGGVINETCYIGHHVSALSYHEIQADAGSPVGSFPASQRHIGSLDKEVIRSIIRGHVPAVKACYERELSRNLDLKGKISSRFTIAADGTVVTSGIMSSTMNNAKVEDCVGREICNWVFPKPIGGGTVIVSYPFSFIAGDASAPFPASSLDKEIIREVIRSHTPAVRACYEAELSANIDLKGRIACQFTIAADGRVIASALQGSTMKNGKVEDCVCREIRNWVFPKPTGGGIVIISYPFNFSPGQ